MMEKTKLLSCSFLAAFFIVLGGILFSSSSTVDKSNSEVIAKLSSDLVDLKNELILFKSAKVNLPPVINPALGEVILFAGNFTPRGWALCNGQLLSITENGALFSILGTTYGGDGRTTFALPDLRGRSAVGVGDGPGLDYIREGQKGGSESKTLIVSEVPAHQHTLPAPAYQLDPNNPRDKYIPGNNSFISVDNQSTGTLNGANMSASTGANIPFSIRDPYLGMNYIIALVGTYPSRD